MTCGAIITFTSARRGSAGEQQVVEETRCRALLGGCLNSCVVVAIAVFVPVSAVVVVAVAVALAVVSWPRP